MTQPKVFEFAKEIGLQPLELMTRLREWKIPVKSHMAELDADTIATIRGKLEEGAKSAPKKTAVKKKAVASEPKSGEEKKAPAAKKPAAAKKATAAAAVAAPPASDAEGSKKGVIRRKAGAIPSAVEAREREIKKAAQEAEETFEASAEVEKTEIVEEAHEARAAHESVEITTEAETQEAEIVEVAAQEMPVAAPAHVATTAPAAVAPEVSVEVTQAPPTPPVPAPAAAAAPVSAAPPERTAPRPGLKKEVIVQPGTTGSRPRGNIVGRMDLARAQSYQGQRPQQGRPPGGGFSPRQGGPGGYGPRTGGPGGGFAPRTGGPGGGFQGRPGPKSNIRPGFFSAPQADIPLPDASGRRGFDDRSRKKPTFTARGTGPAGATEETVAREEVVENFIGTEYRKREVVFQPKKKQTILNREAMKTQITTPKASKRVVKVNKTIKVSEFAKQMSVKSGQVIGTLMKNGVMATQNDELDFDTAALVAPEFGFEAENTFKTAEEVLKTEADAAKTAGHLPRPPIVTVMGHVDHGKTSLLDSIRKADVASGEAGGITQHIGAYTVTLDDGNQVTFIDTPGHEAFTAMRARGANVTDIAIIVVAADDGVMPQTVEAINHAKSAGVPIIVAVNKMDKPNVNPDRIKQQLTEFELVPEEWGGTTIYCPVSALKGTGIKELLEQIHLVAEMQELKADPELPGTGIVIESRMEKGRGVVATLLVKNGTIRVGQTVVAGTSFGRVRAMIDDKGKNHKDAGPSVPVEILGLNEVPGAGDRFDVVANEEKARDIVEIRRSESSKATGVPNSKMSLEALFAKVQSGDLKELPVVLKADVAGSGEAIKAQLEKLATSEVKVKIIHTAIGGVTESDVLLASTAKGIIIGFNVRPDSGAAALASREGVEIKAYSIIYELIDDVKKAMAGLLAPTTVEKTLGRAEVRNVFTVPKVGAIGGCYVVDGKILRSALVRLTRDGRMIYDGKLGSLKRFKDDVREVASGFECGIGIENYNDIKVGDVIEAYEKSEVAREL